LHKFCADLVTDPDSTYSPAVGTSVMASSDTNIYKVKLASDLAKSLQFVSVGGYDVAYLDALVEMASEDSTVAQGGKTQQLPSLALKKTTVAGGQSWKPFAYIGEVKLSDFKEVLKKEGFKTELKAGMLMVNGTVVVRKVGTQVVFEGTMSDDYFAVKKMLLSQYHTL